MDQAGSSEPLTQRPFEALAKQLGYVDPAGPEPVGKPFEELADLALAMTDEHAGLGVNAIAAKLTDEGHAAGWLPPAYELVFESAPLPLLQVERGGLTFHRPGESLTPEQQARHDRLERAYQERWAEDWLTWPVLDGLSWYCARCRFTGPAGEHRGCGNTQLERVRVVVARYFPEPYDDEEDDTDSDTSPEQGERTLLAGTDGTDPRAETGWDGDTVTVREQ